MMASEALRRLDAIEAPFDPLEVLAWTHQERPHTRFLAWLLDPEAPRPGGGHGLGASVLGALVERAMGAVEMLPGVDPVARPSAVGRIDAAGVNVLRELPLGDGVRVTARAPDIRCLWRDEAGHRWVVLIENKVDAGEGDGQVRDYLAWAAKHHPDARRVLLYITPDGRLPDSATGAELVAALSWSDAAEAALEAIAKAPPGGDPAARAFASSVLEALRMRFGGRTEVRALVETLHDAHPRAAALAASPATEPSLLEPLQKRFPRAAWHLRTLRPRAHRWTRPWADRVAEAFRDLCPDGPRLVACAPHADRPSLASWSIEGVTESLSLHAFCTAGTLFGSHRARAWVGLLAPGATARAIFEAREQLPAIEALPEATRAWLLAATPVNETPATWRWLCVGTPAVLARAYSSDDDARRTAKALHGILAPHLGALATFAEDPGQKLFSCDLDVEHALPTDGRDRASLALDAAPDAQRVLVLTRQPTGHPYELRRACDVGLALIAAFGGTRALAYDYGPAASGGHLTRPHVVVVGSSLFRAPDDRSLREAVATLREAVSEGAWVILYGEEADLDVARAPLFEVFGDAPRFEETTDVAEVLCDESLAPRVKGWCEGDARAVFWSGAFGPRGVARPDAFARWWRALVAFGEAL